MKLASGQAGRVGRWQLEDLGVPAGTIDTWVRSGRLHVVHRGAYAVGHLACPEYAVEWGGVLACGREALISHRSAIEVWGLVERRPGFVLQATIPEKRNAGPRWVRTHVSEDLPLDERCTHPCGLPITSAARAVLDFASQAPPWEVARAYEEGLICELFDREHMIRLLIRHKGRRGIRKIRRLVDRDAPPSVTIEVAHARLLELIRSSSLLHPTTEFPIPPYSADIYFPEARLVVEMDGAAFHNTPSRIEHDKLRDSRLVAWGYAVIRVTWTQLTRHPDAVISRIAEAIRVRAPLFATPK